MHLAVELAECQTLVKGYGETHERGWSSFQSDFRPGPEPGRRTRRRCSAARALREAALADDSGAQLERAIAALRTHAAEAA